MEGSSAIAIATAALAIAAAVAAVAAAAAAIAIPMKEADKTGKKSEAGRTFYDDNRKASVNIN